MSYDVLRQLTTPASAATAVVGNETIGSSESADFFAALAEIKELEGEFQSVSVVAHFQTVGFDMAAEAKVICEQSLNKVGIDASSAALINAAGNAFTQFGLGEHKLLAGEAFESEADRINGAHQAGEALDLKAKAKALWDWIMELITKAKAWLLKQFDGAGKLAKAFDALEKAAAAKQTAGKQLADNAKVKLSTGTQAKLSLKGSSDPELDAVKVIDLYDNASDFIYKKHLSEVKKVIGEFGNVAKTSDAEAMAAPVKALEGAVDKLKLDKAVQLTDNKQIASTEVEGSADGDVAKQLSFVATKLKAVSPKVLAINPTAPKFADAKEVAPMELAKVIALCTKGNNVMTALAKRRDEANKGLDAVKDLESAMKAVGAMSDELSAESQQLGKIGTGIASSLNTPVVQFGGLFIDAAGACFTYAKDSVALYTK